MGREKLDTATRREQIAQSALELIGLRGLGALKIAFVARQVGLVPSAIYRHFASKEELLDAVIVLIGRKLTATLEAAREENHDPLETLRRLALLHAKLIRENQAIPRIILSEEVQTGGQERRRLILETLQGYLAGIAEIVREGQRQRRIRADIDPDTMAVLFIGLIQPAAIFWFLTDGKFDVTRHLERAWKTLLQGLVTAPEPRPRRGPARSDRARGDAARGGPPRRGRA